MEIVYEFGRWNAYINGSFYDSATTLQILLSRLQGASEDLLTLLKEQ